MVKVFYNCMYTKIKGWEVPFDVGIEIGTRWGDSFPFKYDSNGNLVPDMFVVEVKEEEIQSNEEIKEQEEEDIVFNIKL